MKQSLLNLFRSRESILDIKAIWFGFTISLGVWFTTAVLGIIWLLLMGEGSYWYSAYIYILGIAGVMAGSFMSGTRATVRGWLHGLWVGVLLGMLGAIVILELMPYIYTWAGLGRLLLVWSFWGLFGGHMGYCFKERFGKEKGMQKHRGY
ncbi:MAG: hypothetical protein CVU87_05520 [Firmicutes bacterium HGW-Firmicutes-12]|nr:MAG: hypothetical protein CVU87_05520 [Firmicutes bacterium HGW-Firmicutes-12]